MGRANAKGARMMEWSNSECKKEKFEFIKGSPVHYPDYGDFALCGRYWLNASTTPSYVTCERCIEIMKDSGIFIPEKE